MSPNGERSNVGLQIERAVYRVYEKQFLVSRGPKLDCRGIDILFHGILDSDLTWSEEKKFAIQIATSTDESRLRHKRNDFFARMKEIAAHANAKIQRGLFLEIDPTIPRIMNDRVDLSGIEERLIAIATSFANEEGRCEEQFGWARIFKGPNGLRYKFFPIKIASEKEIAKPQSIPDVIAPPVVLQEATPSTVEPEKPELIKESPLIEGVILAWNNHPGWGPIRATNGKIFHLVRSNVIDEQLRARLDEIGPNMKALNDPSDRILIRFRDGGPPPIPDDQAEQKKRQKWRKDNAAIDAQRLIA